MRNMAVFSGATIEGITINEYQVQRLKVFLDQETTDPALQDIFSNSCAHPDAVVIHEPIYTNNEHNLYSISTKRKYLNLLEILEFTRKKKGSIYESIY